MGLVLTFESFYSQMYQYSSLYESYDEFNHRSLKIRHRVRQQATLLAVFSRPIITLLFEIQQIAVISSTFSPFFNALVRLFCCWVEANHDNAAKCEFRKTMFLLHIIAKSSSPPECNAVLSMFLNFKFYLKIGVPYLVSSFRQQPSLHNDGIRTRHVSRRHPAM